MSEINFKKARVKDAEAFMALEKKVAHLNTYSGIVDIDEAKEELENNEVYFIMLDDKIIGSTEYQMRGPDEAYLGGLVIVSFVWICYRGMER